ncbi:MAG TPA: hypothetical protein VGD66_15195 [Allosphingosinicella sp.]|jgi:hypothetical protein
MAFLHIAALAATIAVGPAGAAQAAPQQGDADLRGTAGVCVRWGADPKHAAEAVVVVSSGNPTLDRALPPTILNMEWERPASPAYQGEWIGILMAVAGAPANMPLPDCGKLPRPVPGTL